MQCPQCQQDNPPRAKFCLECGSRLVLTCTHCDTELSAGAKFCLECGQPVGFQSAMPSQFVAPATYIPKYLAEKILTARSDLEGERKQVTVLFADIKGSTELIEGLDPEEARQLLDPALHAMMEAVHRYEGTVNQVLGDGIMALFGAPIAHEDHAVRACYAALAMQAAMRRYGTEVRHAYGLEVQIRVGLNSGEVVVRAIDNDLHMDYSAIGQTTHLAARMEQLATPGSIRLTASTLRLVEGLVQVTALGRFPVKGLSKPVEVFELIGASTVRRRLQASAARGLTRFVGRQTELETLGCAQEQAGAGRGQIVEVLEGLSPDRLAEVAVRRSPDQVDRLAHHAFRGAVWDKALAYGQEAGARAFKRAAFRQAATAFEQALAALGHLPDTPTTRRLAIDLRLDLAGNVLQPMGDYEREFALLRETEALARVCNDQSRLARVLARLAAILRIRADLAGALAVGQQALALATAPGDLGLREEVSYRLGHIYLAIGDYWRAAELFRRNMEARDSGTGRPAPPHRARSQAFLAYALSFLGQFTESRRHGEEALRRAMTEGRGGEPMEAHLGLGRVYLEQGDLEAAIRVLDRGLALCRAAENRDIGRAIAAALGSASALVGRLAEGRALLEEAVSEGLRTGGLSGQASRGARLSAVCLLAGRIDEACQHAGQALALARQYGERGNEALALYQLGAVHAQADPPEVVQSEARYREALALAEALGMRPLQAHCHHGIGTLYATTGRLEQARAELSAAMALYRAMDMTFWIPRVEVALTRTSTMS